MESYELKLVCLGGHLYLSVHPESDVDRKRDADTAAWHRRGMVGLWKAEGRCGHATGQCRERPGRGPACLREESPSWFF